MHKLLVVLLLASISIVTNAQEFDPNNLKSEYFESASVKHGMEFNDKQGKSYKVTNSDYSRGLRIQQNNSWLKHGVWYTLYEGRITEKEYYNLGKRDGIKESYHRNGKVQFSYVYVNGVKEGKHYQYRENGTIFLEAMYKNNNKEGEALEYDNNGKLEYKKPYVNGRLHGKVIRYRPSGKVLSEKTYNEGKSVGKTIYYD